MVKTLRIRRPRDGKGPGMPKASGVRIDREGPIHREILGHLRELFPHGEVHHSPNAIGLSGFSIAKQIKQARDMGTVKGWPDLTVIIPGPRILFFEVKAPGNYPDADQRALHDRLRALGCYVAVVRSTGDVDSSLICWGLHPKARQIKNGQ